MRAPRRLVSTGLALIVLAMPLITGVNAKAAPDRGIRALERALRLWRGAGSWRLEFTAADGRHAQIVFEKPHAFSIDDGRSGVHRFRIVIGAVQYQRVGNRWTRGDGRAVSSEFGQSTEDAKLERGHTFAVANDRIAGIAATRYSVRDPNLPGSVIRVWISTRDGRLRRFDTVAADGATTRLRLFDYDSPKNHLVPPPL
ncbi:MAG: hypothetical protein NVSMB19_14910 [Vulcanimicrobiaceae bacterium]